MSTCSHNKCIIFFVLIFLQLHFAWQDNRFTCMPSCSVQLSPKKIWFNPRIPPLIPPITLVSQNLDPPQAQISNKFLFLNQSRNGFFLLDCKYNASLPLQCWSVHAFWRQINKHYTCYKINNAKTCYIREQRKALDHNAMLWNE